MSVAVILIICLLGPAVVIRSLWWIQNRKHILEHGRPIQTREMRYEADRAAMQALVPLKGEPSSDFEAFTACPECKVMDYYQVVTVKPQSRDKLDKLLDDWPWRGYVDKDSLAAARAMPDHMFIEWLECLKVKVRTRNPKAWREEYESGGGYGIPRVEPKYLTTTHKFPLPTEPKYSKYAVVRYCPNCLHVWGQGTQLVVGEVDREVVS